MSECCPICGEKPAHLKIGDELPQAIPRHNLTMYLCVLCFNALLTPPASAWRLVRVPKDAANGNQRQQP